MRTLTLLISFLIATSTARSTARAYEFKLYATFIEETRVELSDGAVWMMDKGDVFPVVQYKNMQKNIILQLAGATFMTDTERVRIIKPEEVPAGIEKYRDNVRGYLDSTSKKIEKKLKEMSPSAAATEEQKAEEKKPEPEASKPAEEAKPTEEKKPEAEEKKP